MFLFSVFVGTQFFRTEKKIRDKIYWPRFCNSKKCLNVCHSLQSTIHNWSTQYRQRQFKTGGDPPNPPSPPLCKPLDWAAV